MKFVVFAAAARTQARGMGARPAVPIDRLSLAEWQAAGSPALFDRLAHARAVVLRGALPAQLCREWTRRVYRARGEWVSDFGGEQFSLGRAFYTHLETDQSGLYFEDAAASDARVERILPGMQGCVRALLARVIGGLVRPRLGFCGPGVHVFPAGGKVARVGGVRHFDVEGLTPEQRDRGFRTATLVGMLQRPERGGGLRLWNARHRRREHPTRAELASPARTLPYEVGDAVLLDSRTLHQIRPFRGSVDRISITAHAVEIDRGVWECWF